MQLLFLKYDGREYLYTQHLFFMASPVASHSCTFKSLSSYFIFLIKSKDFCINLFFSKGSLCWYSKPAIMKQLLLLTTIALFSLSAFSQLNKNQFLVGGNISFSSATYGDEDTYKSKSETLQLSPGVGYFLFDKLAVGTKTEFIFNNSTVYYEDVLKSRSNSITLYFFVK